MRDQSPARGTHRPAERLVERGVARRARGRQENAKKRVAGSRDHDWPRRNPQATDLSACRRETVAGISNVAK
jgi:hypothetical protein